MKSNKFEWCVQIVLMGIRIDMRGSRSWLEREWFGEGVWRRIGRELLRHNIKGWGRDFKRCRSNGFRAISRYDFRREMGRYTCTRHGLHMSDEGL